MNLVPDTPGRTPNYWCTWKAQGPDWVEREYSDFEKSHPYNFMQRQNINEGTLFEDPGWAKTFYSQIRGDLYLVLDDGWDVHFDVDSRKERWRFGSLELNRDRFPSFGGSPEERLEQLNDRIKQLGWRGAGLWVSAQAYGDGRDGGMMEEEELEEYWRKRIRCSRFAGIEYWKVDWGARAGSIAFRQMITKIAREEAPELILEHARCMPPVNDLAGGSGRFGNREGHFQAAIDTITFSDIIRSYDCTQDLNIPVTLDRIAEFLTHGKPEEGAKGLINCEDNVYLGAALGCAFGIMRVPIKSRLTGFAVDRIDEVIRAVRWQRIAPAFGIQESSVQLSAEVLSDSHRFEETWWYMDGRGKEITQHAPAAVARGTILPAASSDGGKPYIVSSRNPNRAVAIATLPRKQTGKGKHIPGVDVSLNIGTGDCPVGIFGDYRKLTLILLSPPGSRRIWAQDLAARKAEDITERVEVDGSQVILDGGLIREIGLMAATPTDTSSPALTLRFL